MIVKYFFNDKLCPFIYFTCKMESDMNCPVLPDKAIDWNDYKQKTKLANRCIFLGVELTETEYESRWIPEKKAKLLSKVNMQKKKVC